MPTQSREVSGEDWRRRLRGDHPLLQLVGRMGTDGSRRQ